jgi:hypothetical protein
MGRRDGDQTSLGSRLRLRGACSCGRGLGARVANGQYLPQRSIPTFPRDSRTNLIAAGNRHVFDSFECAIHKIAPICEHCGCRIVGHGIEAASHFYCCAHCARSAGVRTLRDRAEEVAV